MLLLLAFVGRILIRVIAVPLSFAAGMCAVIIPMRRRRSVPRGPPAILIAEGG